jgi:hypothetical protein
MRGNTAEPFGRNTPVSWEDQEIDAVQIESTRTIEIDQFVPRSEIDDRYLVQAWPSYPRRESGAPPGFRPPPTITEGNCRHQIASLTV